MVREVMRLIKILSAYLDMTDDVLVEKAVLLLAQDIVKRDNAKSPQLWPGASRSVSAVRDVLLHMGFDSEQERAQQSVVPTIVAQPQVTQPLQEYGSITECVRTYLADHPGGASVVEIHQHCISAGVKFGNVASAEQRKCVSGILSHMKTLGDVTAVKEGRSYRWFLVRSN